MKLKRFLSVTLVLTMVMASSLSVFASGGSNGSSGTVSSEPVKSAEVQKVEAATTQAGGVTAVGGVYVHSSVSQVVLAETIRGAAVSTPKAEINAALGIKEGSAKVTLCDTDPKKSDKAMACVNFVATSLNATVVSTINIDLYAQKGSQKIVLTNGQVQMQVGLPKTADLTKTYQVVCVQAGGVVTIVDAIVNPTNGMITFPVNAGMGVYSLICK